MGLRTLYSLLLAGCLFFITGTPAVCAGHSLMHYSARPDRNTYSGTVLDSGTGEPLIGAAVILKGAKDVAAITDVDGRFEITVESGKEDRIVFEVSYLGYVTTEFSPSGTANLKFLLSPDKIGIFLLSYRGAESLRMFALCQQSKVGKLCATVVQPAGLVIDLVVRIVGAEPENYIPLVHLFTFFHENRIHDFGNGGSDFRLLRHRSHHAASLYGNIHIDKWQCNQCDGHGKQDNPVNYLRFRCVLIDVRLNTVFYPFVR